MYHIQPLNLQVIRVGSKGMIRSLGQLSVVHSLPRSAVPRGAVSVLVATIRDSRLALRTSAICVLEAFKASLDGTLNNLV